VTTGVQEAEQSPHRRLGMRVVEARRRAGLKQRALADRLGVSLWRMERLERGEDDLAKFLPAIASATGEREERLYHAIRVETGSAKRTVETVEVSSPSARDWVGLWLVLGSLTTLIVVRFFTEVIDVLPNSGTFIDIPLFVLLVAAASLRRVPLGRHSSFFAPAVLFLALAVVSTLVNSARVEPAPVIVFLYGFLGPLGVYYAVYRLWPPGSALSMSRLLVGLGVVQVAVVATIDLPRFFSSEGNPDHISGTFGENAYQLVFFLIVLTALLAGMATFERRLSARLAPAFFVAIAAIIFLAQYRALLVTTLLSVVIIGALLSKVRGSSVLVTSCLVVVFVGALTYVGAHYPRLKFEQTVAVLKSDPWFFASARLRVGEDIARLYSDNPRYIVTGTGPGTFSSRAWRTFAITKEARTAVAAPYARWITGGEYRTDVSDRYVWPRLRTAPRIQGSRAVTSPYSSYLALLAEVGVLGFVLLVGAYLAATFRAGRLALHAMRNRLPQDPLPALLLAATLAFAVLLQLAVLENWLEVTRITFLSWALLAVGTKELDAREQGEKT
jgi:transcriptional regulator with XRE-family HTH domain